METDTACEIQNNKGLVLSQLSTDVDGLTHTHTIAFDVTGYRYADEYEAHADCLTLERLGYNVSLVEVQ